MELHKRRKIVTEPEARYFMKQVIHLWKYFSNSQFI